LAVTSTRRKTGALGFNRASTAGKMRKANTKAMPTPTTIIQPKSITGRISLKMSEAKATIVVRAVKSDGVNLDFIVSPTFHRWLLSGRSYCSSS